MRINDLKKNFRVSIPRVYNRPARLFFLAGLLCLTASASFAENKDSTSPAHGLELMLDPVNASSHATPVPGVGAASNLTVPSEQQDDALVRLRLPGTGGKQTEVTVDRNRLIEQLSSSPDQNFFKYDRTPLLQVLTDLSTLMNQGFEPPPNLRLDDPKYIVTAVYRNQTPKEVFVRVARIFGFRVREEGGVLRVWDAQALDDTDLRAVVYKAKWINFADYAESFKGFLSPHGHLAVNVAAKDEHVTSITIFDLPEVHEALRDFLVSVDKPSRQIVLDVRYYRFTSSPTQRTHANWAGILNSYRLTQLGPVIENELQAPSPNTVIIPPGDLPLVLSYLEREPTVQMLPTPSVITQSGQRAVLRSITRRPVAAQLVQGDTTVPGLGFLELGSTVKVTPVILNDEVADSSQWEVQLDLKPEVSRSGREVSLGNLGTAPEVLSVLPATTVRIRNGETVLLGGMTDQSFARAEGPEGDTGWMKQGDAKPEIILLVTAHALDPQRPLNLSPAAKPVPAIFQTAAVALPPVPTLPPEPVKTPTIEMEEEIRAAEIAPAPLPEPLLAPSKPLFQLEAVPTLPSLPTLDQNRVIDSVNPSSRRVFIRSPYAPESGLVDVTGLHSGDRVRCPFTGKTFIVP